MTGITSAISIPDLTFALWAAYEARRIASSCANPKGMLRSDVTYLSYPKPLSIRGPNVLVTDAPTFRRSDMEIQRKVLGSRRIS